MDGVTLIYCSGLHHNWFRLNDDEAVHWNAVQYSTVQYSTVQYSGRVENRPLRSAAATVAETIGDQQTALQYSSPE